MNKRAYPKMYSRERVLELISNMIFFTAAFPEPIIEHTGLRMAVTPCMAAELANKYLDGLEKEGEK